jgi:hypothetical protein
MLYSDFEEISSKYLGISPSCFHPNRWKNGKSVEHLKSPKTSRDSYLNLRLLIFVKFFKFYLVTQFLQLLVMFNESFLCLCCVLAYCNLSHCSRIVTCLLMVKERRCLFKYFQCFSRTGLSPDGIKKNVAPAKENKMWKI